MNLTYLHLSINGISDAGATSIADAIKVNKSLTNLKFSLNRIRDAGATSIAEVITVISGRLPAGNLLILH